MTEIIRLARREDIPGIAFVHVDSWRTTYQGIVPADYLANLSYEQREHLWTRALGDTITAPFIYVAVDEHDRIVGFVSGGKSRESNESEYHSELYAIYLLKEYQGHGLGRRLMLQLVERLVLAGWYSMFLWVLKENPTCRFYEVMGGQLVREQRIEIGGVMLKEVAYGWLDTRILL